MNWKNPAVKVYIKASSYILIIGCPSCVYPGYKAPLYPGLSRRDALQLKLHQVICKKYLYITRHSKVLLVTSQPTDNFSVPTNIDKLKRYLSISICRKAQVGLGKFKILPGNFQCK